MRLNFTWLPHVLEEVPEVYNYYNRISTTLCWYRFFFGFFPPYTVLAQNEIISCHDMASNRVLIAAYDAEGIGAGGDGHSSSKWQNFKIFPEERTPRLLWWNFRKIMDILQCRQKKYCRCKNQECKGLNVSTRGSIFKFQNIFFKFK